MRRLEFTINGVTVASIAGEELDQRSGIHWFRYSSLDLHVPGRLLHFDVEPTTTEDAPGSVGEERLDRRQSNLTLEDFDPHAPEGKCEISRFLPFLVFRFFWRNPLTPASRGLWLRLQFRRDRDALFLSSGTVVKTDGITDRAHEGGHPRIWSFSAKQSKFLDKSFLPPGSADLPMAAFATRLALFDYAPSDGTGCALLTRGRERTWIVDASTRDDLEKGYGIRFLETNKDGVAQLAARFFAENGSYAVNSAVLRAEARSAASIDADAIDLLCARTAAGTSYIAEWTHPKGTPREGLEALSLNTVYGALARHYTLGMAAARSRNRFSFAPTELDASAVTLRFDVAPRDDGSGVRETLLRQVVVAKDAAVDWITGAASETGGAPVKLTFTNDLDFDPLQTLLAIEKKPSALLHLRGAGGANSGGWIVNGARVDAGKLATAELTVGQGGDEARYGQAPATIDLRLHFEEAHLTPVSDDPEIGFEALSAWLDRERPIVIDLRKDNPPVRVVIREFANETQSRILRIAVRNPGQKPRNFDVDAVVLDPSPFTAARVVSTTPVDPDGMLAEYSDDSDQAPEWTFASSEGEMEVVLPPQVIGEEMVKGRLHIGTETVPFKAAPFDFRLSPAARLILDRTDINTARAVAPWSLRRLFGQRPGVVGVKLLRAQFELLYGLLSKIEDVPGLRVAELDALVGRVPFPDEFLDFLRAARATSKEDAKTLMKLRGDYCQRIADVIHAMLYRPSWWPVFRDFTVRQQLTITGKGVSASLRESRATANPFDIDKPHDFVIRDDKRPPLRGGVDWPFQSRNVYDELTGAPDSSSLTIEGLAFGSLGGTGKQTAEFNNGKTLIITETTQGRLDSVTVIRIGRIAMLWNRARHVIVYERTTRRAPRYTIEPKKPDGKPDLDSDTWEFQTDDFTGFAALRKVREYVQITEQKRAYPDTSASRPIAGPLKASFFETTIIPVKSTWGHDVPNGFVIALRGPLLKEEERFFPFPKIFLKKARARGKGEGTVDHQLKDPSELLFFTSTRPEDGGDTDLWPAAPDIDFPLIQPKKADLPFHSRFTRLRTQPDAPLADFGQKRFTITVDPPEEAVDLMHGRLSEGIEARVTSVSMARGQLPADVQLKPGSVKLAQTLADTHSSLHDGLAELRMQIAKARHDGASTLDDLPGFAGEAKVLFGELKNSADKLAGNIPAAGVPAFTWAAEQGRWTERLNKNLDDQVKVWKHQVQLPAQATADQARAALQSVCEQVKQRIDDVGFLPAEAFNRIDVATKTLLKKCEELKLQWLTEFDASVDRLAARYRELLAIDEQTDPNLNDEETSTEVPGLAALRSDVDAFLAAFHATLARADVDAMRHLAESLGSWFSPDGLLGRLGTTLSGLTADLLLLAAEIIDSVAPLELDEPEWEVLKRDTRSLIEDFFIAVSKALESEVNVLRDGLGLDAKGRVSTLVEARTKVEGFCADAAKNLDQLQKALDGFITNAGDELKNIGKALEKKLEDLEKASWKGVAGSFDDASKFAANVTQGFDNLTAALDAKLPLEDVERSIAAASKVVTDSLEATARQIESAIVQEVGSLDRQVEKVATAALQLTRILATGPVNDAIACTREHLGYYYDAANDFLDVTRAGAIFNDLGQSVLNSLSAELPFDRVRDRLLPQLQGIDLSQLLPDFGGLKLEYLFPDLKAPDDGSENDWIRVRHGFDKDRLTAFADVDVDKVIDGEPAVFLLPPVSLKLRSPRFVASSRLELSSGGGKSQSTKARIEADWMLCLSDKPVVTMREATLRYDSDGGFEFDFNSENVVLAPEFDFITKALKELLPQEEGLTLTPIMPAGIRAELGLPLPDLTTGAFTLTGLTLYAFLELQIMDGFEVRTGFWLSKPQRPFGLAVVFLGGGGWVGVEVAYRPPDRFVTRVSIGISAGAFFAVNFGFAHGSAGILFTAGVDFFRDSSTQNGRTLITLGILVWGEFSILGIASASLRLMLSVTYDGSDGSMTGHGVVEVSIKICWCYTLHVSQSVNQRFVGGSGGGAKKAVAGRDHKKAIQAVNSNVAL